ncbi:MAG: hypothetical protein ACSLEL_04820 [Candidatus Malihini olakiniferum]
MLALELDAFGPAVLCTCLSQLHRRGEAVLARVVVSRKPAAGVALS